MYLKRIEAAGFKSFASKTTIEFNEGLTAIVGPNGSGKSNVSDAIRFVLGEQSIKSLRGGKMEDIIFAGTDERKPLNIAEVTIVLNNESQTLPLDYNEVSITRRVFRSGGSEYMINGEKVRLKDVSDLIMDSGIGHDSLSMISQDHVKKVVEGKPEDRRLILEESAGILKYKTRKKEAVRKLTATEDNLQRVTDIIHELENQLEPLRAQSQDAMDYLEVKEQLSDLEIRVLAHDIQNDSDVLKDLKQTNEDLVVQERELATEIEDGEDEHVKLTNLHHEKNQAIGDLQYDLTNHAETVGKKKGDLELFKERLTHGKAAYEALEGQIETSRARVATLNKEKSDKLALVGDLQLKLESRTQAEKEAFDAEVVRPLEEKLARAEQGYHKQELKIAGLKAEAHKVAEAGQEKLFARQSALRQLEFLQDAQADFTGFSEGTKHILKGAKEGQLSGIEGAIGQLVTVPSKVETAMDVLLGPLANQIIARTDTDAKKAIQYLKQSGKGRATLLPMNVIKSRRLSTDVHARLQGHAGFVALACDAVTFHSEYRNVTENLLGNVVIATDLNAANEMARAQSHRFRIVTLEGDVINPGGAMTGGKVMRQNSSSVLKRNRDIDALKLQIEAFEQEMLDLESTQQDLQASVREQEDALVGVATKIEAYKQEIAEANEARLRSSYEAKIELASLEEQLKSHQNEVARLGYEADQSEQEVEAKGAQLVENKKQQEALEAEIKALEEALMNADSEKEKLNESLQLHRQELIQLTEAMKQVELNLRENRRLSLEVNRKLQSISGDLGKMDTKLDVAIKKLEHDYEMTFEYATRHYPLTTDIAVARKEVDVLTKKLARFGMVNLGAIDEYNRVKSRYDFLSSEKDDLLASIDNLQSSINEMDGEMVTKFKATFDLVREHYIETFKQLFGGGEADLVLTDPDDLLNTGVDIIARPPGTKLGTSNLLSGGQKALTSIAMLFAILKVRTIPFCILDEVEAALDEVNVTRYANYLKAFSDQTQFIIITHRRGTMEVADILYGVTMQEPGITSMVAVKMEEADEYVDAG